MTNRFKDLKTKKTAKFMGLDVEINKLSVAQVLTIQEKSESVKESNNPKDNLMLLGMVVRAGVEELSGLDDEELFELPMDELSSLSAEIMKYSGMGK